MIELVIVECIPIVLLLLFFLVVWNKKQLVNVPFSLCVMICVVVIFSIALLPNDVSIDKPRYVSLFHARYYWGFQEDYKDPGWAFYVTLCAKLFNNKVFFFFLTTAAIYVFAYLAFAKRFFEEKAFYFLLMSMGCMGFFSYATNTIRPGFAIAFMLLGLCSKNKIWAIFLMICAVVFHRSMIIPFVAYCATSIVDKRWMYFLIWFVCLLFAIINVDLGPLFQAFGFLDDRVELYAGSINQSMGHYKQGFRWDFLLYSVFPMIISMYFVHKHKIEDAVFSKVFNMYLLCNSVWLLAIRAMYTDRLAYLSWFLMPFVVLFPIIKYRDEYKNPNLLTFGLMFFFFSINVVLMII